MSAVRRPPIAFAHRGGQAHAPANTLEAFRLALRLGATGLESDVWLTADAVPVLDHDGTVKAGWRRRPIASVPRDALPPSVPALSELYEACGTDFELSLDVKEPAAAEAAVAAAVRAGAAARLWLCHPSWTEVAGWRTMSDTVRLVDSTRLRLLKEGPERRAARLTEAGVDAVNLHYTDWNLGLTTLFHRFGVMTLAWDCQHDAQLDRILAAEIDGVYSDHVDRMVDAVARNMR
ncbi:MAG: glycerophosphodiester phosphodiesterase [Acidimicrobiales bacterium]